MMQPDLGSLKSEVWNWLIDHDFKGVDPFDGLLTPLLQRQVTGNQTGGCLNRFLRLCLIQCIKRSPINLRNFLGIPPQENAMTWGTVLLGALEGYQRGEKDKEIFILKAISRILTLQNKEKKLWGYPFPWQARSFFLKTNEPNAVISSLVLRALNEAQKAFPNRELTQVLSDATQAFVEQFYKPKENIFSYVAHDAVLVHNANLFGVEICLRAISTETVQTEKFLKPSLAALQKTLSYQEKNGRWAYGTEKHHQWCDNFHTAYNLVSLKFIQDDLKKIGEREWSKHCEEAICRGLDYYLKHAFTKTGQARYYDNKLWPIETHSGAAALILFKTMSDGKQMPREEAIERSRQVIERMTKEMYLGKGRFAYRKWPTGKVRTVYTRWTQAWICYGLEAATTLTSPEVRELY